MGSKALKFLTVSCLFLRFFLRLLKGRKTQHRKKLVLYFRLCFFVLRENSEY